MFLGFNIYFMAMKPGELSLAKTILILCVLLSAGVAVGVIGYLLVNRPVTGKQIWTNIPKSELGVMISTDKSEYGQGETAVIAIKNSSFKEAFITFPVIEKFENNTWSTIRTVWSGCGVMGGLLYLPLEPGKPFDYQWDQKEEWCGKGIETFSKGVMPGKYRIKSAIVDRVKSEKEDPNNIFGKVTDKFVYSNEFIIKGNSVAVSADKTEYFKGETVKIEVNNNLVEQIFLG